MRTFLLKLLSNITCFEIKELSILKLYAVLDKTVLCHPTINITTLLTQKGMAGHYSLY